MSSEGKRWPLTIVRRGERTSAVDGPAAEYEWWQELPPDQTADGLRSVGYEVVTVQPTSEIERLREVLKDLADKLESAPWLRHIDVPRDEVVAKLLDLALEARRAALAPPQPVQPKPERGTP